MIASNDFIEYNAVFPAAEMIDKALEPYADEIERLIGLGMQVQADELFRGILRGLYDFGTAPATPFRDEADDSVEERFGADLLNWRNRLPSHATRPRLDAFLAQFCPKWGIGRARCCAGCAEPRDIAPQ